MNKYGKNEISLWQYILTISGTQVGFSLLTLPGKVEHIAGTDGLISIVIAWAITTLVSLCIVKIMAKHPEDTLVDVLTRYMGKWIGKAGMVIWIVYSLVAAISLFLSTLLIIQVWVLPQTPSYVLMILLTIPIYMLMRGGVRIISRYEVFVFLFTLWMPFVLSISLKDAHWVYLLPLLKEGWIPIFHTAKTIVASFLGFEFAFVLYPYLNNKKSAAKGIVIANTITLLVYLQVTLVCFVYFGPDGILEFLWPTLSLVMPLHFSFLERLEIVFLSFYLFIFLDSTVPYVFAAMDGINQLLNKKDWQFPTCIFFFLMVVGLFFYTPSTYQIDALWEWVRISGFYVAYIFPVAFLLYITAFTRWKRRRR
ncbi:endospore germination permease [Peribacillus sp. NPDC060186]